MRMLGVFPAIGWCEGMAIWANHAQVVELVVRLVAVNVVQFQRHWVAQPFTAATTWRDPRAGVFIREWRAKRRRRPSRKCRSSRTGACARGKRGDTRAATRCSPPAARVGVAGWIESFHTGAVAGSMYIHGLALLVQMFMTSFISPSV